MLLDCMKQKSNSQKEIDLVSNIIKSQNLENTTDLDFSRTLIFWIKHLTHIHSIYQINN